MNHLNIEQFNQAGYPLLWVVTNEPTRVVRECTVEKKFHWDISRGLSRDLIHYEESDPLEVIRQIIEPQEAVIFLENFHHFLENPNVMQGLLNATSVMKSKGTTIVILSPVLKIPPELNPVVRVLMHDLPEDAEYHKCLRDVLEENSTLSDTELQSIVQAGKGMTLAGYEDALALSLVKDGQITPKAIWNEKADMIKKSGLAEIYHGQEKFDDIGGLDGLKQFCLRSLTSGRSGSRGVMLLGVPGTGKSLFAKALGNEVGRCTISLEMSKMYSSLVGETERNIRETLQVIDKLRPPDL